MALKTQNKVRVVGTNVERWAKVVRKEVRR